MLVVPVPDSIKRALTTLTPSNATVVRTVSRARETNNRLTGRPMSNVVVSVCRHVTLSTAQADVVGWNKDPGPPYSSSERVNGAFDNQNFVLFETRFSTTP